MRAQYCLPLTPDPEPAGFKRFLMVALRVACRQSLRRRAPAPSALSRHCKQSGAGAHLRPAAVYAHSLPLSQSVLLTHSSAGNWQA